MGGKQPDSFSDELDLQMKAVAVNAEPEENIPEAEVQEQIADEVEEQLSAGNAHPEMRSNFRTALDELFGKRKEDQPAPAAGQRKIEEDRMSDFDSVTGNQNEFFAAARQSFPSATVAGSAQTSVISSGTVIEGRITSDGHIQVAGTVKGDIAAKGNVRITGSVEGNISGGLIDLNACTVTGNLIAESTVSIDNGSRLTGDVVSEDLIADGTINGNLTIRNSAVFKVHAALRGNVTASALSVEQGAVICGEVKIEHK